MQKQDKDLYEQLLALRESIRSLKVELKRERDECEEAFYDLQEISLNEPTDNGRNKFTKKHQAEVALKDEKPADGESNIKDQSWKHDRQDSGISVKNCDAEADLMRNRIPSKPTIIHHIKQDSGILIDEETMIETKLLSRLVQSSSGTFSRPDFRKLVPSHDRWQQVGEDGISDNIRSRSRSNNDLSKVRTFKDWSFNSRSLLLPKHAHSNSCPSTSTRLSHEFNEYKVVPSHHIRPSQRSANVVDLESLDEIKIKDVTDGRGSTQNRSNVETTTAMSGKKVTDKGRPLRAVLVSASEVNVSDTSERHGSLVSRQRSVDGRLVSGNAKATEVKGSQRRSTVVGVKPERILYDGKNMKQFDGSRAAKDLRISSPSFQFLRSHNRHHSLPENETRRRGSMQIWHTSSKSWDGNMEKPRERLKLIKSTSQVSLV